MLKEIQKKWKNDDFKNDWSKYIAERLVSESINASYKVQKSYNYEVSSYSLPIEESENDNQIGKQGNNNENEENRDDHDSQDQ
ncbi:3117_t:CDS:2, partial [Diversispora eburnea]